MTPPPEFLQWRMDLFDKWVEEYKAEIAGGPVAASRPSFAYATVHSFFLAKPRSPIKVTLPDGREMDGIAWETSPMDIAKLISKSLSERIVIARVDGKLWDLERPLENSCKMELLDFESEDGRMVYWHSSAHVLGEACELHYGCHLCIGPPVEEGFYYEMSIADRAVTQADYPALEALANKAIKEKQNFVRLFLSKERLLEMFKHNPYKQHLIKDKVPEEGSTVYRCGPLIDLCYGPHVPNTGRIKAFSVMKNSSSYFLGDAKNDSLQRIYGISFPDNKMMKEYKTFLEEASKRDHRKIGQQQELFFFHELTPGACFFLPHGARIYNALMDLQRVGVEMGSWSEVRD